MPLKRCSTLKLTTIDSSSIRTCSKLPASNLVVTLSSVSQLMTASRWFCSVLGRSAHEAATGQNPIETIVKKYSTSIKYHCYVLYL